MLIAEEYARQMGYLVSGLLERFLLHNQWVDEDNDFEYIDPVSRSREALLPAVFIQLYRFLERTEKEQE